MIEKVNDINEIISFIKKFFPQYSFNDTFEQLLCFKLFNKVVGFISYSIIYDRAELNYIGVTEEYRRQGIAQRLFDYVLDDLKKNKTQNISLEVSINNDGAINFYLKNGFEIKSIRSNYYTDGDAYLMVKDLR